MSDDARFETKIADPAEGQPVIRLWPDDPPGAYDGPMGLPDGKINTSPGDYRVVRQLQLARFNGVDWSGLGIC